MTSWHRGSVQALATLSCARLRDRPETEILIGGLAMGIHATGHPRCTRPAAQIVITSLVSTVTEWARGPLSHLFGGSLDDPRVELRVRPRRGRAAYARQRSERPSPRSLARNPPRRCTVLMRREGPVPVGPAVARGTPARRQRIAARSWRQAEVRGGPLALPVGAHHCRSPYLRRARFSRLSSPTEPTLADVPRYGAAPRRGAVLAAYDRV